MFRRSIFLLLLVTLFFYKILIFGEVLEGFGDVISYFYPGKFQYAQSLKEKKLFLWNPYIGNGSPSFAEGTLGDLYPLNIIFFYLLPFKDAFSLSLVTTVFLAGIFMYFYARSLRLSDIPALFSAIVFAFSGFVIVHVTHMGNIAAFAFLPLGFFFIEKYFSKRNTGYLIFVSLVVALQVLSGGSQMSVRALLAFSLYYLFRGSPLVERNRKESLIKFLTRWLIVVFLGLGLAAVQIIPSFQLTGLSIRSIDLGLSFRNSYFYPLSSLITFIFPNIFGREFNGDPRIGNYWGPWSYQEMTAYVGILPLFLSLIAFRKRKQNNYILFFLFFLGLSLILAMGLPGGLYFILQLIPPFNKFRVPVRFIGFSVFSLAILSGFGLQQLLAEAGEKVPVLVREVLKQFGLIILILFGLAIFFYPTVYLHVPREARSPEISLSSIRVPFLFITASIILLYLYSLRRLRKSTFALLVLILVILDLFVFGINYNGAVKEHKTPGTVSFLKSDRSIYRILPFPIKKHHTRSKIPTFADLTGNSSAFFGISSADIYSPISLLRYEKFLKKVMDDKVEKLSSNRLLDISNVKYILADKPLDDEGISLVYDKNILIYENKDVLPRAFLVGSFSVKEREEDILAEVASSEFNPAEVVILEKQPHLNLKADENGGFVGDVRIVDYQNERVEIKTNSKTPGILVLSDVFYPGWRVFVDGKEEELYRANYIFRAVPLSSGSHRTVFIFEPKTFKTGAIISLATLGVIIFYSLLNVYKISNSVRRFSRTTNEKFPQKSN